MASANQPATFVLVHGAWSGGWCYHKVAERLRAKGHRVFAPTLTGQGERSHLSGMAINLSLHIADIINVFHYEGLHEVVLAGHSYGGMVITAVADRISERIRALVFLGAFFPADGETLFDINVPEKNPMFIANARALCGVAGAPPPAGVF